MAKPQDAIGDHRTQSEDLSLVMVGIDHHTTPLNLRERVAYEPETAQSLVSRLLERAGIAEACILSTCNRTEVYLYCAEPDKDSKAAMETVFLEPAPELNNENCLYVKRDELAARQLLAVASGLESMVLGEPEILGQVKQAAAMAEEAGSASVVLRKLLRCAARAGGRARSETAISTGAVSLGYAVVELAKNIFTHLHKCRVLLLGAGEIGTQVARDLLDRGARLQVAIRSSERAQRFSREFPAAQALAFDKRFDSLDAVDVLVASTAARQPVVTAEPVNQAMRARQPDRPLLIVDLGVPRNVEVHVGRTENVFLHDLDSLQTLIDRNLDRRRDEIPRVQQIVDQELRRFQAWHQGLAVEPVIALLQKQAEAVRQQELAASQQRFPDDTHEQLDRLTRSLVRKILHHPTTQLRSTAQDHHLSKLQLIRELFKLDEEEE